MNIAAMQILLASAPTHELHDWPSWGQTFVFIFGCSFFLLLNAFFVASEFAIVKVRKSQLDASSDNRKLKSNKEAAIKIVNNLDAYLSANQLGITIASLALGLLAEPFIDALLKYILLNRFNVWFDWDLTGYAGRIGYLSYGVALAFFTVLHVVVGELIPKGLAIRKPLEITLWVAKPLGYFYVFFAWLIELLNTLANWVLKKIFHIDPINEGEHVHSSEELALLVEESERQSEVTEKEREILINALELNDVLVRDVMTSRSKVVTLDVEASFEENIRVAIATKHTRFPLVRGHLDELVGLIHIKDILTLVGEEERNLLTIQRPIKVVPETMALDVLLQFFLREHAHLAMVVDERGSLSGLVFLDNVIEKLVGDIQDEFDNEVAPFRKLEEGIFMVEASLPLNELDDYIPDLDIDNNEVSTLGGYITFILGYIPSEGESIQVNDYILKVCKADDRKIEKVRIERISSKEEKHCEAL